ncbi:lymphocyte antigen-6, epidermis [Syngnathus typhle]|uniref:lymphocyte antigen-6, epidermis n=1 Tax=Syngnathus typhle TaxID=161592 RepID=UPI002A6A521E|nr:lymphocyte antigen-6, epidermis [Syngnathus typhle]
MGRILIGVISALACFMLVESLTCNQCSFGLLGFCLSSTNVECTTNTSQCFTGKATFASISSSVGFNTQGCIEEASCNMTTNSTLLGVAFEARVDCCSTDGCNPVQTSGAPSARMTLAAAIGAAVLASAWGSLL